MKKIDVTTVIIILLVFLNLYQIYVNKNLEKTMKSNEAGVYNFNGQKFPISLIKPLPDKINDIKSDFELDKYNIYALISMQGCQACVKVENDEWERIFNNYSDFINIHVICIDSIFANIISYKQSYGSNFYLYYTDSKLIKKLNINKTPAVFFTTSTGVIIYSYTADINNVKKRNSFYNTIENIIRDNI